jgi:hypothetical protein
LPVTSADANRRAPRANPAEIESVSTCLVLDEVPPIDRFVRHQPEVCPDPVALHVNLLCTVDQGPRTRRPVLRPRPTPWSGPVSCP